MEMGAQARSFLLYHQGDVAAVFYLHWKKPKHAGQKQATVGVPIQETRKFRMPGRAAGDLPHGVSANLGPLDTIKPCNPLRMGLGTSDP